MLYFFKKQSTSTKTSECIIAAAILVWQEKKTPLLPAGIVSIIPGESKKNNAAR
jgi:hypothetical protein